MSWNQGGGGGSPWGGGGQGPWGRGGPGGPQPPNLDELLRKGLDRFKRIIPGGAGSSRGLALIGLIALAIWLATGLYRVLPDEQGVVLMFGKWDGQTTQPGLHYRLPSPIQTVQTPKVTRINRLDIGSRPADPRTRARGVGERDIPEESLMLTGDENIADIKFTVFWLIKDAGKFLFNIRVPKATVKAAAEGAMREIVGKTPIQPILAEGRRKVEDDTRGLLQKILDDYGSGIEITQVQLQKVDPPAQVVDAFRDVQRARADRERLRNQAEAYRNDTSFHPTLVAAANSIGTAGGWVEIKNDANGGDFCRSVWPTRAERDANNVAGHPYAAWGAWTGSAYNTRDRQMYFIGGGHRSYGGNEVYALDLETLTCEIFTPQSKFPPVGDPANTKIYGDPQDAEKQCTFIWEDIANDIPAVPGAGHTYDGIIYSPKTHSFFMVTGTHQCAGIGSRFGKEVWELKLDERRWVRHTPFADVPPEQLHANRYGTALLPNENILFWNAIRAFEVNPTTVTIVRSQPGGHGIWQYANTCGLASDGYVYRHRGDAFSRRLLLNPSGEWMKDGEWIDGNQHPTHWQSVRDDTSCVWDGNQFLMWHGTGETATYDPHTKTFFQYRNQVSLEVPNPRYPDGNVSAGPISKMIWLEELGVFLGYDNPYEGIWLYKVPQQKDDVWPPVSVGSICVEGGECFHTLQAGLAATPINGTVNIAPGTNMGCSFIVTEGVTINAQGAKLSPSSCTLPNRYAGKGYLNIDAANVTIIGLEIDGMGGTSDCVRLQGKDATFRNVNFHDCGNGILSDFTATNIGRVLIEDSVFDHLGGDCTRLCGRSHGVYITAQNLTIRDTTFTKPKEEGHLIKSRSRVTTLERLIVDGSAGDGSRAIDVPNGGILRIIDSTITCGPDMNIDCIAFGLEIPSGSEPWDTHSIFMSGNTCILDTAGRQRYAIVWSNSVEPLNPAIDCSPTFSGWN